jgi:hypothetical protein
MHEARIGDCRGALTACCCSRFAGVTNAGLQVLRLVRFAGQRAFRFYVMLPVSSMEMNKWYITSRAQSKSRYVPRMKDAMFQGSETLCNFVRIIGASGALLRFCHSLHDTTDRHPCQSERIAYRGGIPVRLEKIRPWRHRPIGRAMPPSS